MCAAAVGVEFQERTRELTRNSRPPADARVGFYVSIGLDPRGPLPNELSVQLVALDWTLFHGWWVGRGDLSVIPWIQFNSLGSLPAYDGGTSSIVSLFLRRPSSFPLYLPLPSFFSCPQTASTFLLLIPPVASFYPSSSLAVRRAFAPALLFAFCL